MPACTLASASLVLMLTASFLAAQPPAPAQPRPPQTYPVFLQAQYASLKRNVIGGALEMLTVGTAPNQRQVARANQLTMVIAHGNEHYGNLVTYMRMHGVVPPSSTPR